MEKREVLKILVISFLIIIFAEVLMASVFQDLNKTDFNNGSYVNTIHNNSGVALTAGNTSGSYNSRIFDAGSSSVWNNLSYYSNSPAIDFLFVVDGQADVWKSSDNGVSWTLIKDDYNNGLGNGASAMVVNSSNALFILYNQDLFQSVDNGITWNLVNDDFNGAGDSNAGQVLGIDRNDYIYIIDGNEDVFQSTNSGVLFIKVNSSDFNGGNGNVFGIAVFRAYSNISFQLRNCSSSDCSDGIFINSNLDNISLTGRYFQYQVNFSSPDSSITPLLYNVSLDYSILNIAPNLRIVHPQNSENYNYNASISLNFSVSDINNNLDSCWYNINNGNNISLANCQNTSFKIAGNGTYVLNFYANDSLGLMNNTSVSFDVLNHAPLVSISFPQDEVSYGYNTSLSLNFSVLDSDNNLDKCWYNINNGANISLINCQNTSFNVSGNGNYVLSVYANDSLGEISNKSVGFSVTIGAPSISLHSPINLYLNYKQNIKFYYTPSDIDLRSCELWGNFTGSFGLNKTENSPINEQINNFSLNLNDGCYLWNVKCNDSLGNSAFNGNKSFCIDTIIPGVNLTQPSGVKTSKTNIPLEFSASDTSPLNCSYNLTSSIGTSIITNVKIENCVSTNFSVSSDGDYIIYLNVVDSAGYSRITSSNFSVSSSSNPSDSGGGSGGGGSSSGGSGGGISFNKTKEAGELEIESLGEIITRIGERKTLSLVVRNIGKLFLNNCKLKTNGEISSWIYSTQNDGIAPGENKNFVFDLNIPEGIEIKDYQGELEIQCSEITKTSPIKISFPKSSGSIKINSIKQDKNKLNIEYSFEDNSLIGKSIAVEIWINDEQGNEIKRISDSFSVEPGVNNREIIMELEDNLVGVYSSYFALSSDLSNSVKQTVVLGKSSATGFAILDSEKGKLASYVIFIIIIGIGIFFIIKNRNKEKKEKTKKISRNKELKKK